MIIGRSVQSSKRDKTSISYRRFTLWVGSQRDILNKKGRGIHNEGRDTTNACFNRFLYLVVDCNWKIRSCSRIGRCPSTNVKIGRGRGEFDERNFPGDHLLSSDLRPPSHCYRSGGQMPVLLIQASSSGPEQDRMNLYLGRHDWELARNPINRIPPGLS